MILRRFMQNIKEQNWFAVGLDMMVVMLGIFFGLQITELNEERNDRSNGIKYLQRIKEDIETDLQTFEFSLKLTDERIHQINLLQKFASDPQLSFENPAEFVSSIERGAWNSLLYIEARTWEELVSSGRTLLIKDIRIRNGIFDYYRSIGRWDAILDDFDARIKFINATAGLLSIEQLTAIEESSMKDKPIESFLSVNSEDARSLALQLSNNQEARRWLPKMIQYHMLAKKVLEKRIKHAEELLGFITRKLEDNNE